MYIAQQPISIGGTKYRIGEEVPAYVLLNPAQLLASHVISEAPDIPEPEPVVVAAPVLLETGAVSYINLAPEEAVTALLFAQYSAAAATKAAREIKPGALLEYLKATEKRKTVLDAFAAESDGDSETEGGNNGSE